MTIVADLKEAYETQCESLINDFEKNITLSIIDENWKLHLREMDDLRRSSQGAVYEQKDPLVIYKQESFHLFSEAENIKKTFSQQKIDANVFGDSSRLISRDTFSIIKNKKRLK